MRPHPLKTYLNLTASLPSPPPKKELSKFSYPPKFCTPLPLPPLGSQQKKIPLVFADFRRFCLLVSLRVQVFIVLRRL